jgi:2-dehydropantoate 2-reductase
MNIIIVGAGAIGSLFGGLLSQKNTVVLVGRLPHITAIQQHGLTIRGKTKKHAKPLATTKIQDISLRPDLIILTVKSYDTENAVKQIQPILDKQTYVMSLQNGLDNIETIKQYIDSQQIIAGVTTNGALFSQPGVIQHTGKGITIVGELTGETTERIQTIVKLFNDVGLTTHVSTDIMKEIWIKAIINSSINPLTAFFRCQNGYLLENKLLEHIVERICEESTSIATAEKISVKSSEMMQKTKEVIRDTAQNQSSMLQSIQQGKKTEIDSINGTLANIAKQHGIKAPLNTILTELITTLP